jgi:uracil-DNA glycosylase family 4
MSALPVRYHCPAEWQLSEIMNRSGQMHALDVLQQRVTRCEICPRLREHCCQIAKVKRRAFLNWDYWGKPVPSFGDPNGRLLLIGLAPAAHGANRTGRMFTGDSSGDFLYGALHRAGVASQPDASSRDDGLELHDVYITAAVRCAPPDNKPSPAEFAACRPYLVEELTLMPNVRVVVALGKLAAESYLTILASRGDIARRSAYPFGHNIGHPMPTGLPYLLCSYHPSRQNTQTGRLTAAMFDGIFRRARKLLK